jgi:endogenous inhibitor of DNA gyrase (YacG/DUF329 family)
MLDQQDNPLPRGRRCPLCAKPAATRWQPFCSKRCADVDLGRWLGEVYRLPTGDFAEAPGAGDEPGTSEAR